MKNIISELEKVTKLGYSPSEVFRDWIDLMLFALTGEEDSYLKTVNRYKNNDREIGTRPVDYFANAFAQLMIKMRKDNCEVLGDVYMTWNIGNKCVGQFFTPFPICMFMAKIVGEVKGNVSDPACGAGAMLIAHAKCTKVEYLEESVYYGQDIDLTCVKMTALNLLFFNLNGLAICGNSLGFEAHTVYETTRTPFGGVIRKLTSDEVDILQNKMRAHLIKKQDINTKEFVKGFSGMGGDAIQLSIF